MKKKVLLASAILASSIGLTSCGGGGGGSAPVSTSTPAPAPTPAPATEAGKVLVLAALGATKATSAFAVYEVTVKSDGTASWSPVDTSSLTLTENLVQDHEFNNKNVIIEDTGNLYCYSNGKLQSLGITNGTYAGLPNFFITNASGSNSTNVVLNNCTVANASGNFIYGGQNYVLLDDTTNKKVTVVKSDGTVINNISDTGLKVFNRVENEDTLVVISGTNNIYLVKDEGTVVPVASAGSSATIQNAQVVRVGADYYVAAYDSTNNMLYYAKVDSNNNVKTNNQAVQATAYALDGQGVLYYSDSSNTYQLLIDSKNPAQYTNMPSATEILPLANGALAKDSNNNYYLLKGTVATPIATTLGNAIDDCYNAYKTTPTNIKYTSLNPETIMGKGTNTLMCTYNNKFAWITYDQTNNTLNGYEITPNNTNYAVATQNSMIFVDGTKTKVSICAAGNTKCTDATLSSFDPGSAIKTNTNVLTKADSIYYVKAAYKGSAPYIVDLGKGSVDTSTLNIPFATANPTSGNVSLGLNKVANLYSPIADPNNAKCYIAFNQVLGYTVNTSYYDFIQYKDTNYNFQIKRPDNACLVNVLQVR